MGRYYAEARACGTVPGTDLTGELVTRVAAAVQSRPKPPPSDAWQALAPHRAWIEQWLSGDRPLRLVRVLELLERDGVRVSYNPRRRYVQRELAICGRERCTVHPGARGQEVASVRGKLEPLVGGEPLEVSLDEIIRVSRRGSPEALFGPLPTG